MLFTGHSLGRDKLDQLLRQGRLSKDEINSTYKTMRRIETEELSLDASEIVITSTRQEIEEQWRLYDGFDPILEHKLRARIRCNVSCYGRFTPRMAYNASRGAHLNLKRAVKARILVNKIPALVDSLVAKTGAWEQDRDTTFTYDGVPLLAMLDEYMMLRTRRSSMSR